MEGVESAKLQAFGVHIRRSTTKALPRNKVFVRLFFYISLQPLACQERFETHNISDESIELAQELNWQPIEMNIENALFRAYVADKLAQASLDYDDLLLAWEQMMAGVLTFAGVGS